MLNAFEFEETELLYQNPLSQPGNVNGFVLEGQGAVTFPKNRMRLESTLDATLGQAANIVFWCPETFPNNISISWDFWPIQQPGLCILFFCARGINGEDIFHSDLRKRSGPYDQYHHGDINAYHISYFRRTYAEERSFQTCNLRKSYGFHLVAQGADPIPHITECAGPYRIKIIKYGGEISLFINNLMLLQYVDDGFSYGPVLDDGKIGFRQMAPLIAEYANLQVHSVKKIESPS